MISFVLYNIFYSEVKKSNTVKELQRVHGFINKYFKIVLFVSSAIMAITLFLFTPTKYDMINMPVEAKQMTSIIQNGILIYGIFFAYIYFLKASAKRVMKVKVTRIENYMAYWREEHNKRDYNERLKTFPTYRKVQ